MVAPPRRATGLLLAAILAVAFLVRLAAVFAIEVNPRFGWQFDMTWYDVVARRLVKGWGYVSPTYTPTAAWPPGYPLFLATIYGVFGPSLLAAKVANALLGAATALVTYLIAREIRRPPIERPVS